MDCLGFVASAAARPTSSVPPKAKAAMTKTEQKPLNLVLFGNRKCICRLGLTRS
jgi:hypothetical protein